MRDKLIFEVKKTSKFFSFKNRVLVNTVWILLLIVAVLVYFFIKDGSVSLFITVPFLLATIIYLLYSEYKDDFILLTYLELNRAASTVVIKANRMDKAYIDKKLAMGEVNFQVKRVFSGIGGTSNYRLDIHVNNKCLIKQRGNLIWPHGKIKEMGDEIDLFLSLGK